MTASNASPKGEPRFYTFRQNNSGGSFDHDADAGIGVGVIIEATCLEHAIDRAERIGLYFSGVASGIDCGCCGDRRDEPWEEKGTERPEIYGEEFVPASDGDEPYLDWGLPTYIHYMGGEFKAAKKAAP